MQESVHALRTQFEEALSSVQSTAELEQLRITFLGRKGELLKLIQLLKSASPEERPCLGQVINNFKEEVELALTARGAALVEEEEQARLLTEKIDITLPGRCSYLGRKHIVTQTLHKMIDILVEMGFSVQYGPDIETDYYNFEALNFPPDHPARDMQDTFYLGEKLVLRTHTSNVQTRVMERHKPPIRIIAPGKCYRNEAISSRSHVFFHQVEALYIDKGVTFSDLLATADHFFKRLFGEGAECRYRPSYFPFVEPGMEVDVSCLKCKGAGCGICKQSGWLEVAGAGLVHPEVLKNSDIDPEVYSGFAWGMGVERPAMLKYGIGDIRLFTENDFRFLRQFSGV